MAFGDRGGRWDNPKSKLFVAKYDGKCSDCGWEFDEGDLIGYVDDDIVCEICWDAA